MISSASHSAYHDVVQTNEGATPPLSEVLEDLRRLFLEVILQAMKDIKLSRNAAAAESARNWFYHQSYAQWCDVCGWHPDDVIHRKIRALAEAAYQERKKWISR